MTWGEENGKLGLCQGKRDGTEVGINGYVYDAVSGDNDVIGEPDGKTGGYDGVGWAGQVISTYPYVPLIHFLEKKMININLTGKTALVTGGNSGIGRAIALSLAQAGADVALTYFSNPGEQTITAIRSLGRNSMALRMDATDSAEVNRVVPELARGLGGHINILINNAGYFVGRVPVGEMNDEHWHRVINVNLNSVFYCTRAVLPFMHTGWGRIVNMSSLAAHNGGGTGAVAYTAAKAALLGFTRGLAKELAPKGITVNAVAPGLILGTPLHETFNTEEGRRAAIATIPLKRGGVPNDVAGIVLFLVSDLAGFITGEVTDVNGGAWFK